MGISLCMIARNEEQLLADCLDSVKDLVEEIIFVDTGSEDQTVAIASIYTNRIFHNPWKDNADELRNFSLGLATQEWILVLDADEELPKQSCDAIHALLKDPTADGYLLLQRNYTNSSSVPGFAHLSSFSSPKQQGFLGYYDNPLCRLFKRKKEFRFTTKVHETIEPAIQAHGVLAPTSIIIDHYRELKNQEKEKGHAYYELLGKHVLDAPTDAKSLERLGIAAHNFLGDLDKAEAAYRKALGLSPHLYRARLNLSELFIQKGDMQEALLIVNEGLAHFPDDPWLLTNKSTILINLKQIAPAEEIINIVLGNHPTLTPALLNKAICHVLRKEYAPALSCYHSILSREPCNLQTLYNMALVYIRLGSIDNAELSLEKALSCDPSFSQAKKLKEKIKKKN